MINLITKIKYNKLPMVYTIELNDLLHFRITEAWEYSPGFLENYELVFLISGELHIVISGKKLVLNVGNAFIIPNFSHVRIITASDPDCDFYILSFSNSFGAFSEIIGKPLDVKLDKPYLCELFSHLSRAIAEKQLQGSMSDAILATILGLLSEHEKNDSPKGINAKDILEYIDNNLFCPLTLDLVAKHFSYNKDYILKIFRQKYGITVNKYINSKKLSLAKTLLVKSGMPVSAVGKAIGFEEAALFEKFFKYHEKISPSHYRRIHT